MTLSLFPLIANGVVDLHLPTRSVLDPANDRDAGAAAIGILSVIGPFMVDRFAPALTALSCEKRAVWKQDVEVDPRFVLAQPWRKDRLDDAVQLRGAGHVPSAVQVDRVRFPGLPDLFAIIDGCHRTYAAREAGTPFIRADIHEERICDPAAFFIEGNILMRDMASELVPVSPMEPWAGRTRPERAMLPVDTVMILQTLGCRSAPKPGPHEFTFDHVRGKPAEEAVIAPIGS